MPSSTKSAQRWNYRNIGVGARPPHVLIVDDHAASADALTACFASEGLSVDTAYGCLEALSLVAFRLPDIAILDIMMPVLDGFHTARELRRHGGAWFPIVAFTANDATSIRKHADGGHFDGYCQKGVAPQFLLQLMRAFWQQCD